MQSSNYGGNFFFEDFGLLVYQLKTCNTQIKQTFPNPYIDYN